MAKERKSNIELLRIITIMLITLMHLSRSAYGSENTVNYLFHIGINAIGNMGVTIFILISGYFGIRFRFSKIIELWCIILFYSLLIFLFNLAQDPLLQFNFSKDFIKALYVALTPITSNTWWFFTSYTILFLLSPLLNKASEAMTKKQFIYLLCVLLLFYSISPTFLMHSLSNTPGGKCTENMILAYFIGRYIALHHPRFFCTKHPIYTLLACFIVITTINLKFGPLFMCKDHNTFIILGALSFFYWFKDMTLHTTPRSNNIIRGAATYVFPIYLLNSLYTKYEYIYAPYAYDSTYIPRLILFFFSAISIGIIIESIRRFTFSKSITYLKNKVEQLNFF